MKRTNRRQFLQKSSIALVTAGVAGAISSAAVAGNGQQLFVHHVYFWLKNPSSKEEHARLLKGLQTLPGIDVIKTSHIGVPADTSRSVIDTSYHFSLLLIFNNRKDQDSYQNHPTHLKFVEDCSKLWEKVVVYDSINAS